MFNRYLPEDREAFEDLYKPVEEASAQAQEEVPAQAQQESAPAEKAQAAGSEITLQKKMSSGSKLDLKNILKGFNLDSIGILPLLLLLFLVMDVDDDEKLIILALAVVLGI